MLESPDCPACSASDWKPYGRRVYRAADIPGLPPVKQRLMSVLFERWRPGAEQVELELRGCRDCGMMIYAPRPSDADIAAKYAFLNAGGRSATPAKGEDPARTGQRANRVFALLEPYLPRPAASLRVLDFGGGDGRLMRRFAELGATCDLIDYSRHAVPGVTRIGDNEDALPPDGAYDVIICNHVVEHLASPAAVLAKLRRHLAADGAMYVEVPLEVYRSLPVRTDPVTHVNFFTPASLATLLAASGFGVERSVVTYYPHPKGYRSLAVGAVASARARPRPAPAGVGELESYLDPKLMTRLRIKALKLRDRIRYRR